MSFTLLALAKILAATIPFSRHETVSVPAPEAIGMAERGEAVLIDIRRPDEWQATGRPQGAYGVTLEDPAFIDKISAIAGTLDRSVILICRSGRRTLVGMNLLREAGFSSIAHIGEGMIGSEHGPGWLNRDLPLETWTQE